MPVNLFRMAKVYRQLQALPGSVWRHLDLPGLCTLCGGPGLHGLDLCAGCLDDLPWNRHACLRCALPLPPGAAAPTLCGACLHPRHVLHYDQVWAPFVYAGPMPWLLTQLKFHHRLNHARLLSDLLSNQLETALAHLPDARPDIILPVPLHNRRLRQRGFNQAIELARPVAQRCRLAMDTGSLVRIRPTARQSDLPLKARRRNLRDAFRCHRSFTGQHVVLMDDIMTTGNTLNEAARCLKAAGAGKVSAWVVARTAVNT